MTPEEVTLALAALRRAGAALRERPAAEVIDALARGLDAWRDPASPWRRALEAELPAATGFSPPVVREGLARGLERYPGDALGALVENEVGPLEEAGVRAIAVTGFPTSAVWLAGSIPLPTFPSLLAPLALRSPVLAKAASRDPVTPRLVAESLAAVDPQLGDCVRVAAFPRDDVACSAAALEADCVVANGDDETLAQLAARVRPPRRFVAYGHRVSLCAVGGEATSGPGLPELADRIALDVVLWDQLGCLSPLAVYVAADGPDAADRLAEALAQSLADAEALLPRGAIDPGAAARIASERAEAELRAAAGRRVAVHASKGSEWTVVREADPAPRPAPLFRFVRVHPVADAPALLRAFAPLAPRLAAVALEGFGRRRAALARALAALGASRVCRAGELQSPPLDWPRDNRPVLLPLARLGSFS